MNLLLVAVIVTAVAAASVGLMYAVRRRASSDHFFVEVERGAGVFAFLGTAFAVLLAFVVLEAFGSFNDARTGAESEATSVVEMSRSSEFFSAADRERLAGRVICYARAVIHDDGPRCRMGSAARWYRAGSNGSTRR